MHGRTLALYVVEECDGPALNLSGPLTKRVVVSDSWARIHKRNFMDIIADGVLVTCHTVHPSMPPAVFSIRNRGLSWFAAVLCRNVHIWGDVVPVFWARHMAQWGLHSNKQSKSTLVDSHQCHSGFGYFGALSGPKMPKFELVL